MTERTTAMYNVVPGKTTTCHVCGAIVPWKGAEFPKLSGWDACPMHRAAPDLLAALEGPDGDHPQLTRIEWLSSLLDTLRDNALDECREEDPDAYGEMLTVLQALVTEARAAIAKARRQS